MSDSGPNKARPIFDRALVASHLANGDVPAVAWWSDIHSQALLVYGMALYPDVVAEPYYRLTEVTDLGNDRAEAKFYFFLAASGRLLGILKNEIDESDGNEEDASSIVDDMIFQLDHGLTLPTPEDEAMLDVILETGLDNPTLKEQK